MRITIPASLLMTFLIQTTSPGSLLGAGVLKIEGKESAAWRLELGVELKDRKGKIVIHGNAKAADGTELPNAQRLVNLLPEVLYTVIGTGLAEGTGEVEFSLYQVSQPNKHLVLKANLGKPNAQKNQVITSLELYPFVFCDGKTTERTFRASNLGRIIDLGALKTGDLIIANKANIDDLKK